MKKLFAPKYTGSRYTHRGVIVRQVGIHWIVWENYVDQEVWQPSFQTLSDAADHIERRVDVKF